MLPGFHTVSLSEHDLATAGAVLRAVGFRVMGVRLSLSRLDPLAEPDLRTQQLSLLQVGRQGMGLVLDADGPYMVDPWERRPPGVLGEGAEHARRIEYLTAGLDVLGEMGGGWFVFSVGSLPDGWETQTGLDRLSELIAVLCRQARENEIKICLRPRLGDFIDSVGRFERLQEWLGERCELFLAADIKTMMNGGEMPVCDVLVRLGTRLGCVLVPDVLLGREGGEVMVEGGSVSASRVVAGLSECGFAGPVVIEAAPQEFVGPWEVREIFTQVFQSV
jgi:sugar phosphate isomerase/epimerase